MNFSSTNENIRKNSALKNLMTLRDILDKTKVDLTFDSRDDKVKNNLSGQKFKYRRKPNLSKLETQDKNGKINV